MVKTFEFSEPEDKDYDCRYMKENKDGREGVFVYTSPEMPLFFVRLFHFQAYMF